MVSVKTLSDLRLIALVTLLFVAGVSAQAQSSDFRPFVGLGTGNLTFYGDVGSNNQNFSPLTSNVGYHLKLSNNITDELDLSFETMFGKMSMNERSTLRNLNFRSEIRSGGIHLSYDFGHFLPERRSVTPVINIGVVGFEFLSKTDLFDAEGRRYHYWSDGTIRDREQFSTGASQAELLDRDYVYETDLREQNLDGVGDYKEISYSVPIGAGVQFRVSKYFKCELGSKLYWTGSDLIDNVTAQSIGDRAGTEGNDKFLYTSLTLSYGLHRRTPKDERPSDILGGDFAANASDQGDEDGDGVIDLVDHCPHTPSGENVDSRGCPNDDDKDGVPNYRDKELDSAEGAIVNRRGITVSEEDFAKKHETFTNGGKINIIESSVESADIPKPVFTPRTGRKYMVQVDGSEQGITQQMAYNLLSLPDVQTIQKGDTILYMVGDYATLPDAVKRKLSMQRDGINGSVMESDDGVLRDASERAAVMETALEADINTLPSAGGLYRVQVGAFSKEISSNIFGSLSDLVIIKGEDGLTRYFTGVYTNRDSASRYQEILLEQGYNDAFLTRFDSGERLDIPGEADNVEGVDSYEELYSRPTPDGFDESKVAYRVLLAKSDGSLEITRINQFLELGQVDQLEYNGNVYYLHRTFDTRNEAERKVEDILKAGLNDIEVVGQFNGRILSMNEIEQMLRN